MQACALLSLGNPPLLLLNKSLQKNNMSLTSRVAPPLASRGPTLLLLGLCAGLGHLCPPTAPSSLHAVDRPCPRETNAAICRVPTQTPPWTVAMTHRVT